MKMIALSPLTSVSFYLSSSLLTSEVIVAMTLVMWGERVPRDVDSFSRGGGFSWVVMM